MELLKFHACRTLEAWSCLVAALAVVAGLTLMNPTAEARTPGRCRSPVAVSPGDTLSSIARRCGTTVAAMIEANPHLRDPNILPVGLTLSLTQDRQSDEAPQSELAGNTHVFAVESSVLIP